MRRHAKILAWSGIGLAATLASLLVLLFAFDWNHAKPLPLLRKQIFISTLRLDKPNLLLQRERDGKNNWTFKTSDAPSEWRFGVNALVINQGNIHLIDAIKKADLTADINTLTGQQDSNYRIGWKLKGNFNGDPVNGNGKAGGMLLLQQQTAPYPLQADVRVGKTAIHVKGTLTEPRNLAALDLQLKVSGVSMGQLYRLTGIPLPETPPFTTEGHLSGTLNALGGDWTYEKFNGKMGSSDIGGTLR